MGGLKQVFDNYSSNSEIAYMLKNNETVLRLVCDAYLAGKKDGMNEKNNQIQSVINEHISSMRA